MVEPQNKRKPHHGENIRKARRWVEVTQIELAERMGILQSEVSILEKREVIEMETLQKVAKALDIDVKFLATFVSDDTLRMYNDQSNATITDNTADTNTLSDSAAENESVVSGSGNEVINENIINNNSVPFSEVKALFAQIREQDNEIANMRVLLAKHGIEYTPEKK